MAIKHLYDDHFHACLLLVVCEHCVTTLSSLSHSVFPALTTGRNLVGADKKHVEPMSIHSVRILITHHWKKVILLTALE